MIRYHFSVTIQGVKIKVHINANNAQSAFSKVKRTYPMAEHIHLIRSERRIDNA
jgi:hypothetical protein